MVLSIPTNNNMLSHRVFRSRRSEISPFYLIYLHGELQFEQVCTFAQKVGILLWFKRFPGLGVQGAFQFCTPLIHTPIIPQEHKFESGGYKLGTISNHNNAPTLFIMTCRYFLCVQYLPIGAIDTERISKATNHNNLAGYRCELLLGICSQIIPEQTTTSVDNLLGKIGSVFDLFLIGQQPVQHVMYGPGISREQLGPEDSRLDGGRRAILDVAEHFQQAHRYYLWIVFANIELSI